MRSKVADKILSGTPQAVKDFVKNYANNMKILMKTFEQLQQDWGNATDGKSIEQFIHDYHTAEHERLQGQLNYAKAIDEIQTKGMELAKVLRNADPVMFPTLVIRAEAIEDFCKTLTARGEH